MKEYRVVGRQADKEDAPLYMLTVFAKNHVIAKTKFFGAMSKINKIKRIKAEIVSVEELKEQKVLRARTYGVWIRINSNNNPKNIYKEFRETSRVKAAEKCFQSLAALYKKQYYDIDIVAMSEIGDEDIKREEIKQFAVDGVRFPNIFSTEKPIRNGLKMKKI